jgi:hypothetical protein
MSLREIAAGLARFVGLGIANLIGLIAGLLLLGIAFSFAIWWIGQAYSSPQGFILYSLVPLAAIFVLRLIWLLIIEPLFERFDGRRGGDDV